MTALKQLEGRTVLSVEDSWRDRSYPEVEGYHSFEIVTDAGTLAVQCTNREHIEVEWTA